MPEWVPILLFLAGLFTAVGTLIVYRPEVSARNKKPTHKSELSQKELIRDCLEEVKQERERYRKSAARYSRASGVLTAGEFILGGVIASSFIQTQFSASGALTGTLGVLVLICSLIRQHFKPEACRIACAAKAAAASAIHHEAQRRIADLNSAGWSHSATSELLAFLTGGLKTLGEMSDGTTRVAKDELPPNGRG